MNPPSHLLAWRPDNEEQRRGKFNQIEAGIIDVGFERSHAQHLLQDGPVADTVVEEKSTKTPRRRARTTCAWSSTRFANTIPPVELTLWQMPGVGMWVTATIPIAREADL